MSDRVLLIDFANASWWDAALTVNLFFFWHGPVQLGDDLAHSFGSAGGGGDDVLAGATAVPPQLARGAVHGLLSGGDSVDCALEGRGGAGGRMTLGFISACGNCHLR